MTFFRQVTAVLLDAAQAQAAARPRRQGQGAAQEDDMTRAVMLQVLEALDAGVSISPGSVLHERISGALAEEPIGPISAQPTSEALDAAPRPGQI
jgi:hypothetical protein